MTRDFAAGASASLNKTITAMERFLESNEDRPPHGLRAHLVSHLCDFAVKWYRQGFNRGHKETDKRSRNGRIPRTLRYNATREFFSGKERTVRLRSTLRRKRTKR